MIEKYLPKDLDGKLSRLQEECAEVIQAVCKIQRFGIDNFHPETGVKNSDQLALEIADLCHAIEELSK